MKTLPSITVLFLGALAATQGVTNSSAQTSSVSYTSGSTYTQNFDSLPYTTGTDVNTANPITINGTSYAFNTSPYASNTSNAGTFDFAANADSTGTASTTTTGGLGLLSTMPGWYGAAASALKCGANSGTQTTGGIISFGTTGGAGTTPATTDSNRSLGLLATSSTGITAFAVKFINNSGSSINSVNFGFVGELWHQGAAKPLNYGYYVDTSASSGTDSLPLTLYNTVGSVSSTAGTVTPATPANTTGPLASIPVTQNGLTLNTTWTAGSALWIVFEESSATASSQGFSVDNFSFNVGSPTGVPEPSTWAMMAAGAAGLLAIAWRRARGAGAVAH